MSFSSYLVGAPRERNSASSGGMGLVDEEAVSREEAIQGCDGMKP